MKLKLFVLLTIIFVFCVTLFAQKNVTIEATPHDVAIAIPDTQVQITTAKIGNIFGVFDKIQFNVNIKNNLAQHKVGLITVHVRNSFGTTIAVDVENLHLPPNNSQVVTIDLSDKRVPLGHYTINYVIDFVDSGWLSGTGQFGVYNSTTYAAGDWFGVNYVGDFDDPRAETDLALLAVMGVKNLRFSMQGWIPQGHTSIAEIDASYRVVNITKNFGFNLLCNFLPATNTDLGANPVVAGAEMNESFWAALSRYGNDIREWELSPSPAIVTIAGGRGWEESPSSTGVRFTSGKGIRYYEISELRNTARKYDKNLTMIIGADSPLLGYTFEAFQYKMPEKNDFFGYHYSYIGKPENPLAYPAPPMHELGAINAEANKTIKRTPNAWVTDLGFDNTKNLPSAVNQAVLITRALILNKSVGFKRTYWRNDPSETVDLPFVSVDGSVNPSFLAVRNMLTHLEGTETLDTMTVVDRSTPSGISPIHIYFAKSNKKAKTKKHVLVMWCDDETLSNQILLEVDAPEVQMYDVWGNVTYLYPSNGRLVIPVTEKPNYLHVSNAKNVKVSNITRVMSFDAKVKRINEKMTLEEASISLDISNNPLVFKGRQAFTVSIDCSPFLDEPIIKSFELNEGQLMRVTIPRFEISNVDKINGKGLLEVKAALYVGNQCIALASLPVYYVTPVQKPEEVKSPFANILGTK